MKLILSLILAVFLFSCSNPPVQVVDPPKEIVIIDRPEVPVTAFAYDCKRDSVGNVSSVIVFENKNERTFYVAGTVLFTSKTGETTTADFFTSVYKRSVSEARGRHYIIVETPFSEYKNLHSCQVKSFQVSK